MSTDNPNKPQSLDPKSIAAAAALRYYNEGAIQSDTLLLERLGLAQEQPPQVCTVGLSKAAIFWFASQKMYLEARQLLKSSGQDELGYAFFKGALDLAQRSRRALQSELVDAPVLSKINTLIQQCKLSSQNEGESQVHEKEETVVPVQAIKENKLKKKSENKQQKKSKKKSKKKKLEKKSFDSEVIQAQAQAENTVEIDNMLQSIEAAGFKDDQSLKYFLESRQEIIRSKLKYLPDEKLVSLLELQTLDGFTLDPTCQTVIQKFFNLQTLYRSLKKITFNDTLQISFDLLKSELERMIQAGFPSEKKFLHDALLVSVHVMYLRVLEKMNAASFDQNDVINKRKNEPSFTTVADIILGVCVACFRLGFSYDNVHANVVLVQTSRGFFIGQAFLLSVQYDFCLIEMLVASMDDCLVDCPVVMGLPSDYRLLITMQDKVTITQVALESTVANSLVERLPFLLLKTFEVPQDRQALKLLQLKEYHEIVVRSESLEEANNAALLLFCTLCELGRHWSDLYTTIAGIKSILRRKNLKLYWHEDSPPYWTLKLRTEPANPLQNDPFPKQDQIRKLLKRFDF